MSGTFSAGSLATVISLRTCIEGDTASHADLAINFVKLDDLDEEERRVRDRQVEVAAKGKLLPKNVAHLVRSKY